uniref:Uncharacterized protein n=1 Tax=Anguilla anguilla TaxID=7936 RepID=A0A0E9SQY8_ANGAN
MSSLDRPYLTGTFKQSEGYSWLCAPGRNVCKT